MLKIIRSRLQPQSEKQASFRAGRSTIFNLRIINEMYLQRQQDLCHVFVDFKKAFNRLWHEALWATMRKYNINGSIIQTIENLYTTRPKVQFCSMEVLETGSELLLEFDKDAYSPQLLKYLPRANHERCT